MFDIISIGAATVDIFAKSDKFSLRSKLLCLPNSSKNEIKDALISSGGGATNSAVTFSRLGLKSASLCRLGDDPLSSYILSDLKQDNVDSSCLFQANNESTDYSIILVAPDGSRSILTNRGPSRLVVDNIPWSKISRTLWFYLTSLEGNLDLLEQILGFAAENKIKISFNPGLRELKQPHRLLPLLPHLDFLLLNRSEAEILTGHKFRHPSFWPALVRYQTPLIAVTNGRRGAHVLDHGQNYFSPIVNTTPLDETGAGDAFGSTFVGGLILGYSTEKCLHLAMRNSASVVASLGAKTGLLTLKQLKLNMNR